MARLSLKSGAVDWTDRTDWREFRLTYRDGLGGAASFSIDISGSSNPAPDDDQPFLLTFPSGEKLYLYPPCAPSISVYGSDGIDLAVKATYECIDRLTRLDRIPLPELEFIESNSGEVISTLIGLMDPGLDTTAVATGNAVPYLNTRDFAKFSDILNSQSVGAGGYTLLINPSTGVDVIGTYRNSLGASGISVDKDAPDYSPMSRDRIEPNNEIVNFIKVKGNPEGGPHHTVSEGREIDALAPGFKLKRKPYGIDGTELLNVQFEGGQITASQGDSLPNIVPLDYPVVIAVSDISLLGSPATFCKFIGRNNQVLLGCYAGVGEIGAVVNGSLHSVATPLLSGGAPPDDNHQYLYDWVASFTSGGLEIRITENYLDNTAATTELGTVTGVDLANKTITLSVPAAGLPSSLRFFDSPDEPLAFVNIVNRSGNTIEVDQIPVDDAGNSLITVGLAVAFGDKATVITTDTVISVPTPSASYAKPQLIDSTAVSARSWTANFGPAIDIALVSDPAYGVVGRKLRVATNSDAANADVVVQAEGAGALVTFVGDRLPTRGPLKFVINYDAAKQAEAIGKDQASIDDCGFHAGETITSEFALIEADCQAIADAVIADRSRPSPRGTIIREWSECPSFPLPGMSIALDLPPEYMLSQTSAPISEVSVDFTGADSAGVDQFGESIFQTGIFYHIGIGEPSAQALVERDLLMRSQSVGLAFRSVRANGPRISGFTWNDVDLVSLSISGSVTIGGRTGNSFDPAQFASGNLRETPVQVGGSVDGIHEVFVEVIYPPEPVNPASVYCNFNGRSNTVTYHWARPGGGISFPIEKLVDDDANASTPPVREKVAEVFTPAYETAYEPLSKKLWVQTIGLADKKGGDPVEIVCNLPQIPAPSIFEVVKVKAKDIIVFRVSPTPTGRQMRGRAKLLRVLVRQTTDINLVVDSRDDFPADDSTKEAIAYEFTPSPEALAGSNWRVYVPFTDTESDDIVWVTACWVDGFGDEGAIVAPFDATVPPMTVGSLLATDFWQLPTPGPNNGAANKAAGGTKEDDNEVSTVIDFTGLFRIHTGHGTDSVRLVFEESDPMTSASDVPTWSGHYIKHIFELTDQDAANGYIDVEFKQDFRYAKRKFRAYRPVLVIFFGARIHERIGRSTEEEPSTEALYLVGYDGSGAAPPIVPHQTDAVFDWRDYYFVPGKNGLANNYTVPANGRIRQIQNGFRYTWDIIGDPGLETFLVVISPTQFGTKGPGTDSTIATDLVSILQNGEGQITLYDPTNTAKNVTCYAFNRGLTHHCHFLNGDTISTLTIASGTTYYVSLIAQAKSGRWSSSFSTVFNSSSGAAVSDPTSPPNDGTELPAPTARFKNGLKIKFNVDGVSQLFGEWRAAVALDDGVGNAFNFETSTYGSGPAYYDIGQTGVVHLNTSKADIFAAGRASVRVYYKLTNAAGTTGSEIFTLTKATSEDVVSEDLTAPQGLQTPTLKPKKNAIAAHGMYAPIQNATHQYNEVVFLVFNDSNQLVGYIDPSTNGFSATEVRTNIGKSGDYKLVISRAQLIAAFGGPANRNVSAYYHTTNLVGTSQSLFAANVPFSSLIVDDVALDTAAPNNGSQLPAPTVRFKNDMLRAEWSVNGVIQMATFREAFLTILDTSNNAFNPDTGLWQSTEYFTACGKAHAKLNVRKSQLFAGGRTEVRVFYTLFNSIGGTISGVTNLFLSSLSGESDGVQEDLAVPSGLTVPVLNNQPEVLKAKNMYATASNAEHQFTEVTFEVVNNAGNWVGAGGSPSYIDTTTNSATSDINVARVNIGKSGHFNLKITKAQLIAAFGGPADRNVRILFWVSNKIGRSAQSPLSLAIPFSSLGNDGIAEDSGVPTSLTTPVLVPKRDGVVVVKGIRATANNNSMLYDELVVKVVDNAGTLVGYLDPNSPTAGAAASEALARIQVADGENAHVKVRKDDLIAAWGGPTNRNLRCYYYGINKKGTSSSSIDSASLPFANLAVDSASDPAAPAAPPAPNVKEQDGSIIAKAKFPTSGGNAITKWQLAITDVNSAPSTADPPTATGGATVFDYQEGGDGMAKWRVPGISGTRYFWVRCQNASNPGVWSPWSASTSITGTSRPLKDFIGPGVPIHANVSGDSLAPNGFNDLACTIPSGTKVPLHIWDDGSTVFIELVLPTDDRAFSLVAADVEIYRVSDGKLRQKIPLNPSTTNVTTFGLKSGLHSVRFRLRNMYRTSSNGWSVYTVYAALPTTVTSSNNYDPGANPPPDNDIYNESAYPSRYPSL